MVGGLQRDITVVFLSESDDPYLFKICDELYPYVGDRVRFWKICSPFSFPKAGKEKFFVLNRIGRYGIRSLAHDWLLNLMSDSKRRFVYYACDVPVSDLALEFMERSTVILVNTDEMKSYLCSLNESFRDKIEVVPLHISFDFVNGVLPLKRIDDRFHILWFSLSGTGMSDVAKLLKDLDLLNLYARVICICNRVGILRSKVEPVQNVDVMYFEALPYKDLIAFCKMCDVIIYPVFDDLDNVSFKVKPPTKFLNAVAVKKVLLVSPLKYYREVADGRSVILVNDDSWIDVLLSVVKSNADYVYDEKAYLDARSKFDSVKLCSEYMKVYLGGEHAAS